MKTRVCPTCGQSKVIVRKECYQCEIEIAKIRKRLVKIHDRRPGPKLYRAERVVKVGI